MNKAIAAMQAGQGRIVLLRDDLRQCSLWMFITCNKQTKPKAKEECLTESLVQYGMFWTACQVNTLWIKLLIPLAISDWECSLSASDR